MFTLSFKVRNNKPTLYEIIHNNIIEQRLIIKEHNATHKI